MALYAKYIENEIEFDEEKKIRIEVFELEQGVSHEEEFDGLDKAAIHVIAYSDINEENRKPVATGRMLFIEGKCKLGRIAVLKNYRKKGYGELVVKMLVYKARQLGYSDIFLNSQVVAKGFYERMGFKESGSEFYEAGIKHIRMELLEENCTTCCKK